MNYFFFFYFDYFLDSYFSPSFFFKSIYYGIPIPKDYGYRFCLTLFNDHANIYIRNSYFFLLCLNLS